MNSYGSGTDERDVPSFNNFAFKTPLSKRKQSAFKDAVAATAGRLREVGRPIEELLAT